ncbi:putative membrane protein [Catenulispora sp. MAP5-51]|uniref:TMEM175 family protein n=1 Tax=unclassified Catenulispora TaxID=414885 RepID=UPI0035129897
MPDSPPEASAQDDSPEDTPDGGPDTDGLDDSPDRLIALSDGIFAIAMTLLVLNVSVPSGLNHAQFTKALHDTWSEIGAYALTFAITADRWRDHRRIFRLVQRTDAAVVRLTLALLGVVALLPFPTALLSEYGGNEPLAIVYYAVTMGVLNVLMLALFLAVRRDERLQARVISDRLARAMLWDFGTATVIAVVAILVAFAVSAPAGLMIWLAAIPAGLVARQLRKGA